jgi:hypothetical protein
MVRYAGCEAGEAALTGASLHHLKGAISAMALR